MQASNACQLFGDITLLCVVGKMERTTLLNVELKAAPYWPLIKNGVVYRYWTLDYSAPFPL